MQKLENGMTVLGVKSGVTYCTCPGYINGIRLMDFQKPNVNLMLHVIFLCFAQIAESCHLSGDESYVVHNSTSK